MLSLISTKSNVTWEQLCTAFQKFSDEKIKKRIREKEQKIIPADIAQPIFDVTNKQVSVTILFPHANHLPLFQHGWCPSRSEMFQKHALACFFLLTRIYYLHASHIMLTIPISCLLPHAQRSHSMPIPHYLHIVHHMHSMLVPHYLHTHTICFPYFDHAFPSI